MAIPAETWAALAGALAGGGASVATSWLTGKHQLKQTQQDNEAAAARAREEREHARQVAAEDAGQARREAAVRRCTDFVMAMHTWTAGLSARGISGKRDPTMHRELGDLMAEAARRLAEIEIEGPEIVDNAARAWFNEVAQWPEGMTVDGDEFAELRQTFLREAKYEVGS